MTDKYHQMKLRELAELETAKARATVEYNIMMGILEDPEAEDEEEEEKDE